MTYKAAFRLSLCLLTLVGGVMSAMGQEKTPPRQFAPGVLTTIASEVLPEETNDLHPIVEFRANRNLLWSPEFSPRGRTLYEKASAAHYEREVWCLEFSFKPLRMLWVDVPQPTGKVERKLIWYLVYAVRNTGEGMAPTVEEQGLPVAQASDVGPVRFVPQFLLQGHDQVAGRSLYRAYVDRIIPAALEPIRRRETPGRKLLTSVEITKEPIPVSTEDDPQQVWGVAMWEDLDPNIDFFSIYVRGLTNAYRWEDPEGVYQPGDPVGTGRRFASKTLQLNFWRPGDRFLQHESEVRFGAAPGRADLYGDGVTEGVAYRWVYR